MSRLLRMGLTLAAAMFAVPALGQGANPWAVSKAIPQAPVALPGQLFASTSGAFSQNLYGAPGSGIVPQAAGSFSTNGGTQNGGASLGDYPPLDGLQIPAPAPANPYGTPYTGAPQVQPYQPPMAGLAGRPPMQPYYGAQPYQGTAYAYNPYGYSGGYPAYGAPYGGLPGYGGVPGYGGLGGMMPGGVYPGSSGMLGIPFGGANLTPWGMMSPWGW